MMREYGMGCGWLGMALFWLLLIFLVLAVVKYLAGQNGGGSEPAKALEMLDERYARGEIGRDEYLKRRDDMKGI